MGGTVIALSVQECNAVQIAAGMRLSGRGPLVRGTCLVPAFAMVGGTALRMMGVAVLSTPMIAAATVLVLLMRLMRPGGVGLRPRRGVAAAVGRRDRCVDQPFDVA